jgi:hypothetical protein
VPLGCSVEKYRVLLKTSVGAIEIETGTPNAQFSAAEVSSIGPGQAELSVVQVGDLATSRPASTFLTLNWGTDMESTDRFSLPLLVAGQAQKELFHNEALLALDTIVAGAVEKRPATILPTRR